MRAFVVASFVVGVVLMVAFESWVTRVLGVAALFAFIVAGVFVIADPGVLGDEE